MWRHETNLESEGLDADGLLNSGHCSQLDPPGQKKRAKKYLSKWNNMAIVISISQSAPMSSSASSYSLIYDMQKCL